MIGDDAMITNRQKLGLAVLDYHGGQFTPTYALGSSLFAGVPVSRETISAGVRELRRLWAMPEYASDKRLARIIARLE